MNEPDTSSEARYTIRRRGGQTWCDACDEAHDLERDPAGARHGDRAGQLSARRCAEARGVGGDAQPEQAAEERRPALLPCEARELVHGRDEQSRRVNIEVLINHGDGQSLVKIAGDAWAERPEVRIP